MFFPDGPDQPIPKFSVIVSDIPLVCLLWPIKAYIGGECIL